MRQFDNKCDHKFMALGFEVIKVKDKSVEVVAAVACEKCGLFRTKILVFKREFTKSDRELGENERA